MPTKKYYLTTAIPYVNAKPHLGTAAEFVYADVLARYWRRKYGKANVRFTTGTDEHGQKNAQTAQKRGLTPQQYVDEMAQEFMAIMPALNISYDDFVRTTEERHTRAAQALWRQIARTGDIYKGTYEGWYCVGCEAYKTAKDLVGGECPVHRVAAQKIKEENYFFRLSRYEARLKSFFDEHPQFVVPQSKCNEMKELLAQGLEDISISRESSKMAWGVPVPDDAGQVMYVWFEALINYLTSIGYGDEGGVASASVGADNHDSAVGTLGAFKEWWPAHTHIIGKDINRFHTILWPAMLLSAGLPLPERVGVHGFISVEGQKMSKTLGNVVDPSKLAQQYGQDAVRYYILRAIPFDHDGDFTLARFTALYEADLANGLGNLVSRVTNMVEKYFSGVLAAKDHGVWLASGEVRAQIDKFIDELQFDAALAVVWRLVEQGNEYIEQQKPWELVKNNREQLRVVLEQLLFGLQFVAEELEIFLPHTAEQVAKCLQTPIRKAVPLFPRLEKLENKN